LLNPASSTLRSSLSGYTAEIKQYDVKSILPVKFNWWDADPGKQSRCLSLSISHLGREIAIPLSAYCDLLNAGSLHMYPLKGGIRVVIDGPGYNASENYSVDLNIVGDQLKKREVSETPWFTQNTLYEGTVEAFKSKQKAGVLKNRIYKSGRYELHLSFNKIPRFWADRGSKAVVLSPELTFKYRGEGFFVPRSMYADLTGLTDIQLSTSKTKCVVTMSGETDTGSYHVKLTIHKDEEIERTVFWQSGSQKWYERSHYFSKEQDE
jgi:hypothetical protein